MADVTPLANHILRGAVVQVCHNISSRKSWLHQNPPNVKVRAKTICPTQTCSIGWEGICCVPGKYANQSPKALFGCRLTGDAARKTTSYGRDYFLSHWFRPLSWTNQYFLEYHKKINCHCSGEIDCTGVMKRHPFAGLKQINIQFA